MNNKEMMEKALGPILRASRGIGRNRDFSWLKFFRLLAKQATAIECEITHYQGTLYKDGTWLYLGHITGVEIDEEFYWSKEFIGTPGKALGIIVPLPKKNDG